MSEEPGAIHVGGVEIAADSRDALANEELGPCRSPVNPPHLACRWQGWHSASWLPRDPTGLVQRWRVPHRAPARDISQRFPASSTSGMANPVAAGDQPPC